MPRKYPLYYQKSKAAKQLEYDYDYDYDYDAYSDSGSFLGQSEISLDSYQYRPQKTKEKYKRTRDYPYYDDQYNERRRNTYDEKPYMYDSDYTDDVEYISINSEASGVGTYIDRQYDKHKKERKKRLSEKPGYNHTPKHDDSFNTYRKQRNPPMSTTGNEFTSNENNYNIYVSQEPIKFRLKDHNDYTVPVPVEATSGRRRKSKENKVSETPSLDLKQKKDCQVYTTELTTTQNMEQGDAPHLNPSPTDFTNLSSQLIFKEQLSNLFQNSAQSLMKLVYLPVVVMNNSKTSLMTGSILPGLFLNNMNEKEEETPQNPMTVFTTFNTDHNNIFEQENKISNLKKEVSISKHTENRDETEDPKKNVPESLINMLQPSEGSVMTASSYAALLTSQPVQATTSGKNLLSIIKASKIFKKKSNTCRVQSTSQIAAGGENKHARTSNIKKEKSLERDVNDAHKMSANEEIKLQEMRRPDLENMEDRPSKNLIININKKSFANSTLSSATPTKDREINKISHILSNVGRKSTLTQKGYSGFPLLSAEVEGKYKTVGPSQQTNNLGQTSNIYGQSYEGRTTSVNNQNPRNMSDAAEGRNQTLVKMVKEERNSGINDEAFVARESRTNVPSGGGKDARKSKSILKKEISNELNGNDVQVVGEMKGNNPNNQEENRKNNSQENKKVSKFVPTLSWKKSQSDKSQLVKSSKEKEMSDNEIVRRPSWALTSQVGLRPNDVNYEFPIESLKKNPSLKIIYPRVVKSSAIHRSVEDVHRTLYDENTEILNHGHHSKIWEYSEFLIVSFKAAQFILGVSCYDKLIDVIGCFCADQRVLVVAPS